MSHTSETNGTTRDNSSFPTSVDDQHDELMASLSADTIMFGTRRIRTPTTLPAFATVRGTLTSHLTTPTFPHAAATTPYQLDTTRDLSAVSPELHSELTASLAADTIVVATPGRRRQAPSIPAAPPLASPLRPAHTWLEGIRQYSAPCHRQVEGHLRAHEEGQVTAHQFVARIFLSLRHHGLLRLFPAFANNFLPPEWRSSGELHRILSAGRRRGPPPGELVARLPPGVGHRLLAQRAVAGPAVFRTPRFGPYGGGGPGRVGSDEAELEWVLNWVAPVPVVDEGAVRRVWWDMRRRLLGF